VGISITAGDWIVQEGMYDFTSGSEVDLAPNGIDSLLINSGTYPGTGWSVTDYTVLKSFIDDNTTDPENPTPELLAMMADKMQMAGYPAPPVWIANPSVWTSSNARAAACTWCPRAPRSPRPVRSPLRVSVTVAGPAFR
jgi:hypothetical protein